MAASLTYLQVRALTAEEATALQALAQSRTAEARVRDRAEICWQSHQGAHVTELCARLGWSDETVRRWLHRFNAGGIAALADAPRAGRPPTLTPAQVSEVIAVSRATPASLDQPFGCWTLDRLTAYLREARQLPIQRSRFGEVLRAEGRHWRRQESWLDGQTDPEFAEKRGDHRLVHQAGARCAGGVPR